MKQLSLTQGKIAFVDDADWLLVSAHKWCAVLISNRWYAVGKVGGKAHTYLHRFILEAPHGVLVDHVDGNGLDCRRKNMRFATSGQNNENLQAAHRDSSTGVRGVWLQKNGRYRAGLGGHRRRIYLGIFKTLAEAEHAAIEGRKRYMTHSPECTEKAG